MSNGDNVIDMLNPLDQESVRQVFRGSPPSDASMMVDGIHLPEPRSVVEEERLFVARLVAPKNARRNGRSPKPRVKLAWRNFFINHYMHAGPGCSRPFWYEALSLITRRAIPNP